MQEDTHPITWSQRKSVPGQSAGGSCAPCQASKGPSSHPRKAGARQSPAARVTQNQVLCLRTAPGLSVTARVSRNGDEFLSQCRFLEVLAAFGKDSQQLPASHPVVSRRDVSHQSLHNPLTSIHLYLISTCGVIYPAFYVSTPSKRWVLLIWPSIQVGSREAP